jgi:hypothetical protein
MAVTEVDEAARDGTSSGERKGNATDERIDAANACTSV